MFKAQNCSFDDVQCEDVYRDEPEDFPENRDIAEAAAYFAELNMVWRESETGPDFMIDENGPPIGWCEMFDEIDAEDCC
jgi:hypothetical protein